MQGAAKLTWGQFFCTIFSAENEIPLNFPRNLFCKRFFKVFHRGKFQFFSTFLGENFPGILCGNNVRKIGHRMKATTWPKKV
jgi:hypothetical protein